MSTEAWVWKPQGDCALWAPPNTQRATYGSLMWNDYCSGYILWFGNSSADSCKHTIMVPLHVLTFTICNRHSLKRSSMYLDQCRSSSSTITAVGYTTIYMLKMILFSRKWDFLSTHFISTVSTAELILYAMNTAIHGYFPNSSFLTSLRIEHFTSTPWNASKSMFGLADIMLFYGRCRPAITISFSTSLLCARTGF